MAKHIELNLVLIILWVQANWGILVSEKNPQYMSGFVFLSGSDMALELHGWMKIHKMNVWPCHDNYVTIYGI